MELDELQKKVDAWIKKYGIRYFDELTNMAILTEEVGEVARIIARRYGEQSEKESDKYFYSRPKDSQIGAVASDQSKEIPNRKFIEDKFRLLNESKSKITRPKHWGGIIVSCDSIEFWQGRKNRLHDRILFDKDKKNNWVYKRLSP